MYIKTRDQLKQITVKELKDICRNNDYKGYSKFNKADLIEFIIDNQSSSFETNVQYIYNDTLKLYSIIHLDYINLSIKDMTDILISNFKDIQVSNQTSNLKEFKALYNAGFRINGHETISYNEALNMFNKHGSLNMRANTNQYNTIKQNNKQSQDSQTYKYYYTNRGFSIGCQPSDFISHDDNEGYIGSILYNRPLTNNELKEYELKPA